MCCRWTIAARADLTPILPEDRCSCAGRRKSSLTGWADLNENGIINVKNKSHSITAQVVIPEGTISTGVILSQGGIGGGWMFYVNDGKPAYFYNFAGLPQRTSLLTRALTAGSIKSGWSSRTMGAALPRAGP